MLAALCEAGLRWNAEADVFSTPYVITRAGGNRLWRLPVVADDWMMQGSGMTPERMLAEWQANVDVIMRRRRYGAVGFHPWVLGMHPERMTAFRSLMRMLRRRDGLTLLTFGAVARECERRLAARGGQP